MALISLPALMTLRPAEYMRKERAGTIAALAEPEIAQVAGWQARALSWHEVEALTADLAVHRRKMMGTAKDEVEKRMRDRNQEKQQEKE